jgi:2,3-dihydroxybenzoate decarboxylase
MRKITLEEHFTPRVYQHYLEKTAARRQSPQMEAKLVEAGDVRLRAMDEAEIDIQVLSLTIPGLERVAPQDAVPLARDINDEMAEVIRASNGRYAGFAALPTMEPTVAADELERAVSKLGFKGAMLNGQPAGGYLDEMRYWEILARAEALGVPIYLHPSQPAPETMYAYAGRPELVGPVWSFTVDTATQALRLVFAGVFDRYPGLTIILGHLGETLPYWLWRLDSRWKSYSSASSQRLERMPSRYILENMYITTSGFFSDSALLCAFMSMGADRILFSVDYPFEPNTAGAEFIEHVPISEADRRKICYQNAERLLKL